MQCMWFAMEQNAKCCIAKQCSKHTNAIHATTFCISIAMNDKKIPLDELLTTMIFNGGVVWQTQAHFSWWWSKHCQKRTMGKFVSTFWSLSSKTGRKWQTQNLSVAIEILESGAPPDATIFFHVQRLFSLIIFVILHPLTETFTCCFLLSNCGAKEWWTDKCMARSNKLNRMQATTIVRHLLCQLFLGDEREAKADNRQWKCGLRSRRGPMDVIHLSSIAFVNAIVLIMSDLQKHKKCQACQKLKSSRSSRRHNGSSINQFEAQSAFIAAVPNVFPNFLSKLASLSFRKWNRKEWLMCVESLELCWEKNGNRFLFVGPHVASRCTSARQALHLAKSVVASCGGVNLLSLIDSSLPGNPIEKTWSILTTDIATKLKTILSACPKWMKQQEHVQRSRSFQKECCLTLNNALLCTWLTHPWRGTPLRKHDQFWQPTLQQRWKQSCLHATNGSNNESTFSGAAAFKKSGLTSNNALLCTSFSFLWESDSGNVALNTGACT